MVTPGRNNACNLQTMTLMPARTCINYRMFVVLWIVCLNEAVRGQMTLFSELWRDKSVCVDNIADLMKTPTINKYPKQVCTFMLDKRANKTHQIEGEFYSDHRHLTNLTLKVPCPRNLSSCDVEERNTSCPDLNLCCRYIALDKIDGNKIKTMCPNVLTNDSRKSPCEGSAPVTYHHSIYSATEVHDAMANYPDNYHWTDSYIARINASVIKATERYTLLADTEDECIYTCLNFKESPKVSFVAYNSKKNCSCYARDQTGRSMVDGYSVYEVRDAHNKSLIGTKKCIAAILNNSSVEYHVENCSFSYILLCGPIRCSKQDTGYICDYSGITAKSVLRETTTTTQTTSSAGTRGTMDNQGKTTPVADQEFPTELVGILAAIVVGLMLMVFVLYKLVIWLKRKCSKKPMERGRPNSMSNRTYLMQNAEDNDDLYSTITENVELNHEIQRPLLPPRNNHDLIMFKTDYSTPSDNIVAPPLVTDLDVYTDTYDNPLRKSRQNSSAHETGVIIHDILRSNGTILEADRREVSKIGNGAADVDVDITKQTARVGQDGLQRESGDIKDDVDPYEIPYTKETNSDYESKRNQPSKNYYLLDHSLDSLTDDSKEDVRKDVMLVPEKSPSARRAEADNLDYEDTSTIDGNFDDKNKLNVNIPAVERERRSDEKNLLCTLSPVLLKQLNIKIVPDENEYSFHYKHWPRSSSDDNVADSDDHAMHDGTKGKFCNPRENAYCDKHDYDKLCYVRRVVSARKPRNLYYHVVLKEGESRDKEASRRASV